jgi:hypothetical protein
MTPYRESHRHLALARMAAVLGQNHPSISSMIRVVNSPAPGWLRLGLGLGQRFTTFISCPPGTGVVAVPEERGYKWPL